MKARRLLKAALPLIFILCLYSTSWAGDLFAVIGGGGGSTKYQNVVGVAGSGASYTSITDALDSITDAAEDNRYLVAVGPGTYEEQIQLKEWVDVRGAGRQATKITSTGGSSMETATVLGADNSEISNLTVESTGDGVSVSVGVFNNGVSPRLDHLDIIVQGSEVVNNVGVWNLYYGSPEISDLSIQISGSGSSGSSFGISNEDYSSPSIRNTTINISSASGGSVMYGIYNISYSESEMHNLDIVITGTSSDTSSTGIYNYLSPAVISQCRITLNDAANLARGVYNHTSSASLTDINIIISSTAGSESYGVINDTSDGAVLSNIKIDIDAATGTSNCGVRNYNCSPTLSNLILDVAGSSANDVGMQNNSASPVVKYCSIVVDQPTGGDGIGIHNSYTGRPTVSFCDVRGGNYGMKNSDGTSGSDSMVVIESRLKGADGAVDNGENFEVYFTGNILDGGVTNNGTIHCADCYDESGNAETCE